MNDTNIVAFPTRGQGQEQPRKQGQEETWFTLTSGDQLRICKEKSDRAQSWLSFSLHREKNRFFNFSLPVEHSADDVRPLNLVIRKDQDNSFSLHFLMIGFYGVRHSDLANLTNILTLPNVRLRQS